MARRKQVPPPPKPTRRRPGSGTVGVRSNGRIFVVLPKDLDPKRLPRYGPKKRQGFTSPAEAGAWLDAEIHRLRNPTAASSVLAETLGAHLDRWLARREPFLAATPASGDRTTVAVVLGATLPTQFTWLTVAELSRRSPALLNRTSPGPRRREP